MLQIAKDYEFGMMKTMLKKIADGRPRTATEIAKITNMTPNEASSNLKYLAHDVRSKTSRFNHWGYTTSYDGRSMDYFFEITSECKEVTRTFIEIDEKGKAIPGSKQTRIQTNIYYTIVSK